MTLLKFEQTITITFVNFIKYLSHLKELCKVKGVFRTLSNIQDGAICFQLLSIFTKRCMQMSNTFEKFK